MKILVADDNPLNLRFVERVLSKLYDVETANDGLEALNKVYSSNYDLIILDLWMPPGLDGAEVTYQIRQYENKLGDNTPILIYSTSQIENDKKRCLAKGADQFLIKPVDSSNFIKIVKSFEKGKTINTPSAV